MPTGIYKRTKKHRDALKRGHKGIWSRHKHPNLGRKLPAEHIEKIRKANTGKKKSLEERKKISDRMKGNTIWAGKKHSKKSKYLMSQKARKNEKSNFWKGGATKENKKLRSSARFRRWRDAVYKRDDYTCVFCGKRGGRLNPDHIKKFADFPDLRFNVDNGRTLCEKCHKGTDTYGNNHPKT